MARGPAGALHRVGRTRDDSWNPLPLGPPPHERHHMNTGRFSDATLLRSVANRGLRPLALPGHGPRVGRRRETLSIFRFYATSMQGSGGVVGGGRATEPRAVGPRGVIETTSPAGAARSRVGDGREGTTVLKHYHGFWARADQSARGDA